MQHDTDTLHTSDGLALFTRRWRAAHPPRAALLLVHGIDEHSGRYAYPAAHLLLHDVAVYAYDHRGHGQSEGPRAYVETFDEYVDDLRLVHERARAESEGVPVFLLGHSLGGLIAAKYVVDHEPALPGLILSSPALQIPSDLSPLLQRMAGLLSQLVPRLPTKGVPLAHLSRDPKVAQAFKEDPLTNKRGVRARLGHEILEATRYVRRRPEAFTMPLYLFHGTADRITDPDGSRWLYAQAPAEDKTLKLYDGLYHETMNEPERDTVLADLTAWIEARL